jgi:hypothetical protein
VTDCNKVLRIELGEERIAVMQTGIMLVQAGLEKLPPSAKRFETSSFSFALAIIASQIAEHSFAFKDHCCSDVILLATTGRYVGAVPAFWQSHFHGARRKAVRLRPDESQPFQPGMLLGFTFGICYSRSHFASSRTQ